MLAGVVAAVGVLCLYGDGSSSSASNVALQTASGQLVERSSAGLASSRAAISIARIAMADDLPRRRGRILSTAHPGQRLREAIRLDRSRVAVAVAVSSAVGFAVPLAVGLATGQLAEGVAASAGALIVGFANLGGGYRVRAATLFATTPRLAWLRW